MPKKIQKSVRECFPKIKISDEQIQFRSCRHAKMPSFDVHAKRNESDAVTLSEVDQFLYEKFGSLYLEEGEEGTGNRCKTTSFLFESPKLLDPPPPPETLRRSGRFFVASGSSSSLITDEACSFPASTAEESEEITEEDRKAADDFIVIFTHSPSPYEDFRRSMQEMVEARVVQAGKVDWEFLEELLFCYLDLNNKKSHRYILHAFVDLIVVLRGNPGKITASRLAWNGRGGRRLKGGDVILHA
ncbi:uncharacterized protein [Primulina huaijiensis]|uniref:uncharacterized protein n=1 Tax=Primulina huaijiensis TaxID=1492673 RepID=UPI003CC7807A